MPALAPPGAGGQQHTAQAVAIRSFYNYLGRRQQLSHNPANGVQAPKRGRRLPKTLDVDQMDQFLKPRSTDPLELRDIAMAELFYSSGLRLAELAAINLDDIDPDTALVTVLGKGSKTRTVPVGTMALAAIEVWRKVRPRW